MYRFACKTCVDLKRMEPIDPYTEPSLLSSIMHFVVLVGLVSMECVHILTF